MSNNNFFARQDLVLNPQTGQKIKDCKILVVGAGAGGNEVLKNLALMGFGNFTIIDFDEIEASNLSRTTLFRKEDIGKAKSIVSASELKKISLHENPQIIGLDSKIEDIGAKVFLENDIIISCVDVDNVRAYINDWAVRLKKPLFEMGFNKFVVQVLFFPNDESGSPCLREVIGMGDLSGKRQSCSQLKIRDNSLSYIPTIQISASFAGTFIATEVILFLENRSKLKNKWLQYSADYHRLNVFTIQQDPKCHIHQDYEYSFIDTNVRSSETIKDVLEYLKQKYDEDFVFRLDNQIVLEMNCEECDNVIHVFDYKKNLFDEERWCNDCRNKGLYREDIAVSKKWVTIEEIHLLNNELEQFAAMSLSSLKVKANDLIKCYSLLTTNYALLVGIQ